VPQAELESATFCSASKRSIQLRYWGIWSALNIPPEGGIVKRRFPLPLLQGGGLILQVIERPNR
jgi:hypothetical protein